MKVRGDFSDAILERLQHKADDEPRWRCWPWVAPGGRCPGGSCPGGCSPGTIFAT